MDQLAPSSVRLGDEVQCLAMRCRARLLPDLNYAAPVRRRNQRSRTT